MPASRRQPGTPSKLCAVAMAWLAAALCLAAVVPRRTAAAETLPTVQGAPVARNTGNVQPPVWQPRRPADPEDTRSIDLEPFEPVAPASSPAAVRARSVAPAARTTVVPYADEPYTDQPAVVHEVLPWTDQGEYLYMDPGPVFEPIAYKSFLPRDHNLLVSFGVHGFKGPADLGRNGNFGFHEGVNWAAPLGDPWGFSYQVGIQGVHSDFAGNQVASGALLPEFSPAERNQVFFTAGIFRRAAPGGWQSAVAFDLFYDHYYDTAVLQQMRSETAYVLSDLREIGYWGAYGLNKDTISGIGQFDTLLDPTDLFAAFYRRHFTGGGLGRVWAGVSGHGDVILGLDGTVPLGTSWALDNNFTCLVPRQGREGGAQAEESWSVSIQLVWYPGRTAIEALHSPSHPMFYVADNSWFLVDRRQK